MVVLKITLWIVRLHILNILYQCLLIGSLGITLSHLYCHIDIAIGSLLGFLWLNLGLLLLSETAQESRLNVAVFVLVTLIDYYCFAVVFEFNSLSGWVVEHQWLFLFFGLVVLGLCFAWSVNGKLNLINIQGWVEHLTNENDCCSTEVCKECYSNKCKNGRKTRGSNKIANEITDKHAMIAARAETCVSKQWLKEGCKCYRCPNHKQSNRKCPLE